MTLASVLARFWWGFELTTHFRVQYVLASACCAVLLMARRQRGWAVAFMALALLNAVLVKWTFGSFPETRSDGTGTTLRALLANVNSANRDDRRIRELLLKHNPDVVVLLEATPWLMEHLTALAERYPHRIAEARDDNFGIALLSRHPLTNGRIARIGAAGLPSAVAELHIDRRRLVIVGTHPLPPMNAELARRRNEQLASLAEFARQTPDPLVMLGDLNITPWSPYFERLLADSGLRDGRGGHGLLPTWPVGWPMLWIPIDHVLVSDDVQIRQWQTGAVIGSDHYPVIVDFQLFGS
ncbi:MAG: endonuclease/exonuclease/phosphatase family protein [Candidatus Competibacteraceae bacterium]|nr:endonuclease/exonuclease/phosphatase family protein [Candidatus Competibacteraceae bacterium]